MELSTTDLDVILDLQSATITVMDNDKHVTSFHGRYIQTTIHWLTYFSDVPLAVLPSFIQYVSVASS